MFLAITVCRELVYVILESGRCGVGFEDMPDSSAQSRAVRYG